MADCSGQSEAELNDFYGSEFQLGYEVFMDFAQV